MIFLIKENTEKNIFGVVGRLWGVGFIVISVNTLRSGNYDELLLEMIFYIVLRIFELNKIELA